MSSIGELFIGLVMAIGIVGTVLPIFPGLLLTWTTGLVWAILDGGGPVRWSLFAVMTIITAAGLIASVRIPVQSSRTQSTPPWALLLWATCAVVGFFVIPVLGVFVGFALGVLASNFIQTRDLSTATERMLITLQSFGKTALIQAACATAICGLWVIGLIFT